MPVDLQVYNANGALIFSADTKPFQILHSFTFSKDNRSTVTQQYKNNLFAGRTPLIFQNGPCWVGVYAFQNITHAFVPFDFSIRSINSTTVEWTATFLHSTSLWVKNLTTYDMTVFIGAY